jgi:hypothetical protein
MKYHGLITPDAASTVNVVINVSNDQMKRLEWTRAPRPTFRGGGGLIAQSRWPRWAIWRSSG